MHISPGRCVDCKIDPEAYSAIGGQDDLLPGAVVALRRVQMDRLAHAAPEQLLASLEPMPLSELFQRAQDLRRPGPGTATSHPRNAFLPLPHLCRPLPTYSP